MSAARARSRAEKAIFDIASTNGTTLCFLMSMCSTTSTSSSDFFGFIFFRFVIPNPESLRVRDLSYEVCVLNFSQCSTSFCEILRSAQDDNHFEEDEIREPRRDT